MSTAEASPPPSRKRAPRKPTAAADKARSESNAPDDPRPTDRRESQKAEGATSTGKSQSIEVDDDGLTDAMDAIFGPPSNVVDISQHQNIDGLGEHEHISRVIPFDGDVYWVITYQHPSKPLTTHRMAYREVKQSEDNETVLRARPVIDGLVECVEVSAKVAVDSETRQLSTTDAQQDIVFLLSYKKNNGEVYLEYVTDSEFLNTNRSKTWLTRLGMSTEVRTKKHGVVLDMLRAVIHATRSNGLSKTKVIDRTGPVYVDGKLCYANATGYIKPDGNPVEKAGFVFGPEGIVPGIRCEPALRSVDHFRDIEYPVTIPTSRKDRLMGLDAVAELLTAYQNPGLTGILVGQLIASPIAGLKIGDVTTASVTIIVGPSRAGKTAYEMLLFTSQTRKVYGEVNPAVSARVAEKNSSNGARPAGIYQHLSPYSGCLALLDDVMKDDWSESRQLFARDSVMESVVTGIMSGGALQAQGNNGKVEAAPSKRVYHSAVFTAECVGPVPKLLDDSTYNRMAIVWWDKGLRCDRQVYNRLKSQEQTLLRNDGLRVTLDILLRNPAAFVDGYKSVLQAFDAAGITDDRVSKNYARCLAGLYILDLAYRENGRTTKHLTTAIAPAIEIARRLETHGTYGGDQKARTDIVEATREAFAILLDQDKSVFIAEVPEKAPDGSILVPTEPTHLPYGFSPGHCGWYPDTDTWKHKSNAIQIGVLIEKLPRSGGRPHPFAYRIQMSASEWRALHDKLNYVSSLRGFRQCSREERLAALTANGVMATAVNKNKATLYQLDYLWVRSTTYEDVIAAESTTDTKEDE